MNSRFFSTAFFSTALELTIPIILAIIEIGILVLLVSGMMKEIKFAKASGRSAAKYWVMMILGILIPIAGFIMVICLKFSVRHKLEKNGLYVASAIDNVYDDHLDDDEDIFMSLSDDMCSSDLQKKSKGEKKLNNNINDIWLEFGICPPDSKRNLNKKKRSDDSFDIKDYFRLNYGLYEKPPVFKLKGLFKLLYLLIIPIIIKIIFSIRRSIWNRHYDIRNRTWHKKFDEYYDQFVSDMNIKETAITKLDLDSCQFGREGESQVEPFSIGANSYNGYWRKCPDGLFRTDISEITWIFFTVEQVLTYRIVFSLTGDVARQEVTNEFFYNDIVSISTTSTYKKLDISKSYEDPTSEKRKKGKEEEEVPTVEEVCTESFRIIAPGATLGYSFYTTPRVSESIHNMKELIRNKKKDCEVAHLKEIEKILVNDITASIINNAN